MFGFGKKSGDSKKTSKAEERYVARKQEQVAESFFGSAKEESDRKAKRGDF